jgi:ArsR family transcriptional regulator, zinc-responsive transcriptional repressor
MNEGSGYGPVTEFFGALASPIRAAIVHLLTDQPHTVSQLCEALGASQPLVSQHLRILREADLVVGERVGRSMTYSLADEHVSHVFLDAYVHTQEDPDDRRHGAPPG